MFPEHTKLAYEEGAEQGADYVECDLTITKVRYTVTMDLHVVFWIDIDIARHAFSNIDKCHRTPNSTSEFGIELRFGLDWNMKLLYVQLCA